MVTRNQEGDYIMIKLSIHQKDTLTVNIYTSKIGTPKYIKEILTERKGKIDNNSAFQYPNLNN